MPLAKSLQGRTYKKRPRTMFYQKKKQPTVKSLNSQVKALRKNDYSLVPMTPTFEGLPFPLFDAETLVANTPVFDDVSSQGSATIFEFAADGDRLLRAKFFVQLQNVAAGSTECHFRLMVIRDNRADDAESISYSGGAAPICVDATPFATYNALSLPTDALDNSVYPTYLGIKRDDVRLANSQTSFRTEILYDKRVTLSDSGFGEEKDWEFELDLYGVKQSIPDRTYRMLAICDQAVILDVQCTYTILHRT